MTLNLVAQTVKLKITYKDYPVQNSDITIKIGDASIGTGRTDNDGEVSISCSNLFTKNIDVYGSKTTSNTTKTWDVKGYVNLDGNNFYHMKMEVFAKEMADASGGFMSESSIAAMWGLAAGGKNDSENMSSNSNTNTNNNTNSNSNNQTTNTEPEEEKIDLNQMREDNLLTYKQNLENDIIRFERKIKKDEKEINEARAEGKSQTEIRRLEIDKQIDILTKEKKEILLRETNAKIAKTELSFEEKRQNSSRKDQIKDEISLLKDEDKKLKNAEKTASKEKEIEITQAGNEIITEEQKAKNEQKAYEEEEKFQKKSKQMLKLDLTELKVALKKKNLNFKIQAGAGIQEEEKMTKLKEEIVALELKVEKYEKRIAELEGKEEK